MKQQWKSLKRRSMFKFQYMLQLHNKKEALTKIPELHLCKGVRPLQQRVS